MGHIGTRTKLNLVLKAMAWVRMVDALLGTRNACYGCHQSTDQLNDLYLLFQDQRCVLIVLQGGCFFSPLIPLCYHRLSRHHALPRCCLDSWFRNQNWDCRSTEASINGTISVIKTYCSCINKNRTKIPLVREEFNLWRPCFYRTGLESLELLSWALGYPTISTISIRGGPKPRYGSRNLGWLYLDMLLLMNGPLFPILGQGIVVMKQAIKPVRCATRCQYFLPAPLGPAICWPQPRIVLLSRLIDLSGKFAFDSTNGRFHTSTTRWPVDR
jgi:hypothetical protein